MDGRPALAGGPDQRHEVVPGRQPATDLTLRQLDEQGGERLADRFEIGQRQQLASLAQRPPDETMQPLIGLVLVELQVARRVERDDSPTASIGMDPQGDLLGHRAARHEDRGGLAQQLADLGLEGGHHATRAVFIGHQLLGRQRSELGEHVRGAAQAVASERTVAVVLQSRALLVRQCVGADHGSSVAWSGWRSMIGSPSHCAAGAAQKVAIASRRAE